MHRGLPGLTELGSKTNSKDSSSGIRDDSKIPASGASGLKILENSPTGGEGVTVPR